MATVLLLRFSPILAAAILGGTAVLMVVQDRLSGLLRRRAHTEQRSSADATAQAEDLVRGLRVLRGIGAEEAAATNYRRSSRTALAGALSATWAQSALGAAAALVTGLYLAVIVGVGGWLALSGRIGLGPLVSALGLSQFILGPMRTVAGFSAVRARALASASRIGELLDDLGAEPESASAPTLSVAGGAVRFADVELAPGRTASFTAPAGALTGLVLDDPVAAARVVALLGREDQVRSGEVTVDGAAIEGWPLEALRSAVLVSPHDAALFAGTIGENIAVRASDAATAERAMWAAFADQVVEMLPDGARTEVGDRAQRLSGGQRQRVALARALAADPPVLILHDPTTSIDAATEDELARRLRAVRTGRTTLVVTSSPALLARCDQVVVVDEQGVRSGGHA
ncbi:MAG: ABC transporter ATP-binding protein, partial [Actinobacteria bacterium]|nr:ABC transporter ATP-binding protein [Actinomycetota bacterium]